MEKYVVKEADGTVKNYEVMSEFRNGFAKVRDENMKWLVINKKFEQVTPRVYDRIYNTYYGYSVVELEGKYGFIDEAGNEMCEIKYEHIGCFNEYGFAPIVVPNAKTDRTYWIDTQGKEYYLYFHVSDMHSLN